MIEIALKMLIEDRAKYIGMVLVLSFSTLIIIQQSSIFVGLMMRTYSVITDTSQADVWIMDPNIKMIDDINGLRDTDLYRVRSVEGVAWAVPMYKGVIRARMMDGQFQTCNLIGIDDSTLIGGPHTMITGKVEDLRAPDAIIVDSFGARDKLNHVHRSGLPKEPLTIGDQLELNDLRANVVGICAITRTFQTQPVIYTTYKRALSYAPYERKRLSFILVKADGTVSPKELATRIFRLTGFESCTQSEFKWLTVNYYLKNTGIPINFGIAVLLGLLVGAVISAQIFYNFVSDNLKYLAIFSVMGASKRMLALMTIVQALWVSFLGWGIGSGCAALIGFATRNTELSFFLAWQVFLATGLIMVLVALTGALFSIRRIYTIELGTIFQQ
jgi:putative ABC transport system permease protein